MNKKMVPRIIAIVTVTVLVVVAVFGIQWKSITKVFTAQPKIQQQTTEVVETGVDTSQEPVEIMSSNTTEVPGAASSTPVTEASIPETAVSVSETAVDATTTSTDVVATTAPAQTAVVAETAATTPNATTATATTAEGTPITVVVQMPETLMQQPQTERQTEKEKSLSELSEEELTERALKATWTHYYNLDIQANGLAEDDFNFGPNPITDGQVREAEYYDAELRECLKWDPALAAATTAWVDANVGTRYLGVFYETCEHNWATTINAAKLRFAADQMAYYKNLDALFAFMNSATSVEIRPCQGVTDQMYMNPYTASGIPDVIVMETTDQTGYQLVYKFTIKGDSSFEVAFRINCGFQPTNVAKLMNIAPQPEPVRTTVKQPTPTPTPQSEKNTPTPTPTPQTEKTTPTPTPTPQTETDAPDPTPQTETDAPDPTPETETDEPDPTPETETDAPEPTPTPETETEPTTEPTTEPEPTPQTETEQPQPTPLPEKDPSEQQADNAEPNDNPGPDENTNNGGLPESTAEMPENSGHYDSYDDYVDTMQDLQQTNEEQQVGGDSNEPSYTPEVAPGETVAGDNNGDSGNARDGADPIDDLTTNPDPAVAANTGEAIDTTPGTAIAEPE